MNTFNTISDLEVAFIQGEFDAAEECVMIGEREFRFGASSTFTTREILENRNKPVTIYESGDELIACVWTKNKRSEIVPTAIQVLNKAQIIKEFSERDLKQHYEGRTIGKTVEVVLMGLNNNQPIKCKIDTGAELCSLDAQDINIVPDQYGEGHAVKFTLNGKVYRVALEERQAVQTADGGVNYRPVIKLTVKMGSQTYSDILFNLNDRSDMPDPILLGLNFLEKGDFLIDPKMESVELYSPEGWTVIQETVSTIGSGEPTNTSADPVDEVIAVLNKHPTLSFADIISHITKLPS